MESSRKDGKGLGPHLWTSSAREGPSADQNTGESPWERACEELWCQIDLDQIVVWSPDS